MRTALITLVLASIVLMTVPAASAQVSDGVAVCSAYNYDGEGGETTLALGADEEGSPVQPDPSPEDGQAALTALVTDLADGDAEDDSDTAPWDVGPDPFDGHGYGHLSVYSGGDEVVGHGTDSLTDWSTEC